MTNFITAIYNILPNNVSKIASTLQLTTKSTYFKEWRLHKRNFVSAKNYIPMFSRPITKESWDRVFPGNPSIDVEAFRDQMVNGHPFGLEPQTVFQTTDLQRKGKIVWFITGLPRLSSFVVTEWSRQEGKWRWEFNWIKLTPWSWVLEKPPVVRLLNNLPTFYASLSFITVCTTALRRSLSWTTSIQPTTTHFIARTSLLIWTPNLSLNLPSGSLLLAFQPKYYMHSSSTHRCYISNTHTIIVVLVIIIIIGEEYKSWSSHYVVFSNLLSQQPSSVQMFSSAPCSQLPSLYCLVSLLCVTNKTGCWIS
jgi:hypothetical protein